MRELSQIRDAVVSTLAAEGMAALDAYPDQRARRYGCPVAAVAVETAESRTVGFCNYLGEVFDTGAGAPRELYGKQLEAVISIEIRGQRAADCEQGCETAAEGMEAPVREPERVSLIISSERADAILARLYQLSRNQSLELFRTKKVYINGRLCENNSCQLKSGDMVSARGYGRFLYYGAAGETRKGRLNAAAGVYR